ncbi:2'-5' RNA ligase family protein [Phenylobacterium sp.]|uniref:2'-5' RNA ligase family protein n=1 Tax=Phenylobacterium sp. TaxID=1871053 RepID=UPI002730EBE9|nr:2'-5' RNA ligase family protein [Phenylobacterium sp.]MDP1598781.1 2'-5' RNA ligase family protein [Phenylobacterium sp.]MDP3595219.1 2'-5' RNA ligase family protein [Phenylobacterium sp.]
MSEQLSLDIPEPSSGGGQVVFFAVTPGAAASARLSAVGKQTSDASLYPPARFHISLLGLRLDVRSGDLDAMREVGSAVAAAPFEIVLPTACSFGNSLVLCCAAETTEAMTYLQHALLREAKMKWPLRAKGRYTPHLTLAYRAPRIPPTVLADPVRWPAREFVLVGRDRRRDGYACFGRWPLN